MFLYFLHEQKFGFCFIIQRAALLLPLFALLQIFLHLCSIFLVDFPGIMSKNRPHKLVLSRPCPAFFVNPPKPPLHYEVSTLHCGPEARPLRASSLSIFLSILPDLTLLSSKKFTHIMPSFFPTSLLLSCFSMYGCQGFTQVKALPLAGVIVFFCSLVVCVCSCWVRLLSPIPVCTRTVSQLCPVSSMWCCNLCINLSRIFSSVVSTQQTIRPVFFVISG